MTRAKEPPPFDIENAVGHYLLTLQRCTNCVLVISRHFLDECYNYEMTVDASNLAGWAERHAKGAWSSNKAEQTVRKTLPLWLHDADLSDNSVTFPPNDFFNIWRGYHSTFYDFPGTQVFCHECKKIIDDVLMLNTHLPPREIFDVWKYEWHCPHGHLLYKEEIGRHAHARKFPIWLCLRIAPSSVWTPIYFSKTIIRESHEGNGVL